jgi:CBS domain-containing protein
MKVKDVMTTSVACVRTNESLSVAAQLMWDCDCGSIPVIEETGGAIVGMVTDRDICMATWIKNRAPSSISVTEAMSPELYFVLPDDRVSTAENLMRSKQIRRVPVLNGDRTLAGILSLADIANESQRVGASTSESDLAPTAVADTLASISRPRPQREPNAHA